MTVVTHYVQCWPPVLVTDLLRPSVIFLLHLLSIILLGRRNSTPLAFLEHIYLTVRRLSVPLTGSRVHWFSVFSAFSPCSQATLCFFLVHVLHTALVRLP